MATLKCANYNVHVGGTLYNGETKKKIISRSLEQVKQKRKLLVDH